uniref:Uncharacterized protein n=1 Tax=Ditylenchus dipsaci TaxID=166011 RepID=A0A915EJQ4_9BILA
MCVIITDADLEKLYEEWEANDDEELPDDEKPDHLKPRPNIDFEHLKHMSNDPDDMIELSKKGQSVMMFLNNNHVDVQVYAIEDDRLLFMFKDGSQAGFSRISVKTKRVQRSGARR